MKTLFFSIKQKNRFLLLSFASLFVLQFTSSPVIGQSEPNCVCAVCGYACGSGHASDCKYSNNSNSNSSSTSNSNWSDRLKAYKETRQQTKIANALAANEKGIEEYNKKNWAAAVKYFKKAVRNNPANSVMSNNLKNAEDAYAYEKASKKLDDDRERSQREIEDNQRKRTEEQRKKETEQQQALQKSAKDAMEKDLNDAQQKIYALQKDVSRIQQSLKIYSRSLQNNSAEFEKWGSTVDEAYNNVIENSKGYLAGMFLKYNLLGGLKREEQKIIYNNLRDILGSSNPELQKWLAMVSKSKAVGLDEVEDIIDRVNQSGDLAVLLTGDKKDIKHNLDALLFANSLIEGFNLAGYKEYIKNIAKPFGMDNMPGDYYEQAKMIGETYADLSSICYSWYMIHKLTTDNEAFADKVALLSYNMQHEMNEINCLKKCINEHAAGSIGKCTGVTRLSTPPPLLR